MAGFFIVETPRKTMTGTKVIWDTEKGEVKCICKRGVETEKIAPEQWVDVKVSPSNELVHPEKGGE